MTGENPRGRTLTPSLALAALLVAAVALACDAQSEKRWPVPEAAKKVANPAKPTPQALNTSRRLYRELCEHCHGDAGKGDGTEAMMYSVKPANFTDKKLMDAMTDGELFFKLTEGRRPMPSFKNSLSEEQRWQLVHFIRSFSTPPAKGPAPARK